LSAHHGGDVLERGRAQAPLLPKQPHIDRTLGIEIDQLRRAGRLQVGNHAPAETEPHRLGEG
jgi:hypothetical protein